MDGAIWITMEARSLFGAGREGRAANEKENSQQFDVQTVCTQIVRTEMHTHTVKGEHNTGWMRPRTLLTDRISISVYHYVTSQSSENKQWRMNVTKWLTMHVR